MVGLIPTLGVVASAVRQHQSDPITANILLPSSACAGKASLETSLANSSEGVGWNTRPSQHDMGDHSG